MNILIEIPARGGSKGVPRKALRLLDGKPLIAHTIEHALTIAGNTKVVVNTDDPEIQQVARNHGAECPFLRPSSLAGDTSSLDEAVRYSSNWLREHENYSADIYIIMSPTNPFRRPGLVDEALQRGQKDKNIFNIGSVAPAPVDLANYWSCQDLPYPAEPNIFPLPQKTTTLFQSSLSFNIVFLRRASYLADRHTPVLINDIEAIDIDESQDFQLAQAIINQNAWPHLSTLEQHVPVAEQDNTHIFGKKFRRITKANTRQVIHHPDFPLLTSEEINHFSLASQKIPKILVTARPCQVHPYRLRYLDQTGFSAFLMDIPQAIRGNRHLYPKLYSFQPALIAIPPGLDINIIPPTQWAMYVLPAEKLLDKSLLSQQLLISYYTAQAPNQPCYPIAPPHAIQA